MNTELLQKINQIGKGGIVREGIFVRFPDLLPAVREHYWREDGDFGAKTPRKPMIISE